MKRFSSVLLCRISFPKMKDISTKNVAKMLKWFKGGPYQQLIASRCSILGFPSAYIISVLCISDSCIKIKIN